MKNILLFQQQQTQYERWRFCAHDEQEVQIDAVKTLFRHGDHQPSHHIQREAII